MDSLKRFLHGLYPALFKSYEEAETNLNHLIKELNLPDSTSHFITTFRNKNNNNTLFVLATQQLSEMSVSDTIYLIQSVNPNLVIAHVNKELRPYLYSECGKSSSQIHEPVPDSALQVLRKVVSGKESMEDYEKMASMQLLQVIFGTNSFGYVTAAFNEAKKVNSDFILMSYRQEQYSNEDETVEKDTVVKNPSDASKQTFSFSLLFPSLSTPLLSSSIKPQPSMKNVNVFHPERLFSQTLFGKRSVSVSASTEIKLTPWPNFANKHIVPFVQAYALGLSDMDEEIHLAKKIALQVAEGERVKEEDIRYMWKFREVTEQMRIRAVERVFQNQSMKSQYRSSKVNSSTFDSMDEDEQEMVLLSHAIFQHLEKNAKVVALVNASDVPSLQRHLQAEISEEVAKRSELYIIQSTGMDSHNDSLSNYATSSQQTNYGGAGEATAIIGAGTAAVTVSALFASKFGYLSGILKLVGFKIPSLTKAATLLWKRSFAISTLKSIVPNFILSSKTVTSVKTTAAAAATKGSGSGGLVANAMVDAAQKYSLGVARTAFYRVMQQARTKSEARRKPRPWALMGVALIPGASLLLFSSEFERAIEILPSVNRIARLGQGLKYLNQSMRNVEKDGFWTESYGSLYKTNFQTTVKK